MSKDQKEIKETSETESKKSSKIFLLVFLVAVTALAAIYFLMSDNEKVVENEPVEIIEEEKPYSRLDMIMLWLAVLAGCTLVWCSIWFVGRTLLK